MQVDVVIDEFYAYDPTTYDLTSFMMTYNITGDMTAANASFPFLRNAAVYRSVLFFAYQVPFCACVVVFLVKVCSFSMTGCAAAQIGHVRLLARVSSVLFLLLSLP